MRFNFACWLIATALLATPLTAQEIYRVVDPDGNVTYTDQKPDDDAEPVDLPEINVLDDEDEAPLPAEQQTPEVAEPLQLMILQPGDGDVLSAADGSVEVEMSTNVDIPPTAQIVLFLNGQPQEPVRSLEVTLDQMPPGVYRLRAELQTPSGRRLVTTDSVGFEVVPPGDDLVEP